MQKILWVLFGVTLAGLLASASLARHYRKQGAYYRQQLESVAASAPRQPNSPSPQPSAPVSAPEMAPPVMVNNDPAPLQERVRQLELQLAERDTLVASLREAATNRPASRFPARRDDMARMETLKASDPKLYEEMEKRRQEARQTVQNAFARRADYLLRQDTSNMGQAEKEQYEQMVQLLDETWKLSALVQTTLPPEQRWDMMRTIRDNMTSLGPLLTVQRNREFYNLGLSSGYSADEASAFVTYLNDVIDLTSTRTLFQGVHSGPPHGTNSPAGQPGTPPR